MLETILDPELGIDIWTMGLIYDISIISDAAVKILMTLTSPFCPVGPQLKEEVEDALKLLGFTEITVEITFDPPWTPSAELKAALGV